MSQISPIRRGTTLIEVLLGLVLLATVMTAAIVARGRFIRQWADAERRLQLIDAADRLMSQLVNAPPAQLAIAGGPVQDVSDATWQTSLIPDGVANSLQTIKVRLRVTDGHSPTKVDVEFLVHNPKAATQPAVPR